MSDELLSLLCYIVTLVEISFLSAYVTDVKWKRLVLSLFLTFPVLLMRLLGAR